MTICIECARSTCACCNECTTCFSCECDSHECRWCRKCYTHCNCAADTYARLEEAREFRADHHYHCLVDEGRGLK